MKHTLPHITFFDQTILPDTIGLANSPVGFLLAAWQSDVLVRLHLLPAHSEQDLAGFLADFGWRQPLQRDDARAQDLIQTHLFPNGHWRGTFGKSLKIGFYGTAFQRDVMTAMLAIPTGKTLSYGQVHKASRAVGSVCARNPLPFIVPCHRVTPSKGNAARVGHYAFGPALKQQLLRWEAAS